MENKLYNLIFLLCISTSMHAQEVLKIRETTEANFLLSDYLEMLCDTTNSIDISHLRSGSYKSDFKPFHAFTEELSNKNSYWLHMIVDNSYVPSRRVGIKFYYTISYIDVYSVSDGILHIHQTGFLRSGSVNDELFPCSNIIEVPIADRIEYFIRLTFDSFYEPDIGIELISIENETKSIVNGLIFDAVLHGVLWLIILYGLLHYFRIKDRAYLYYALYALFVSIMQIWGIPPFAYQLVYNMPRSIHRLNSIPSLFPIIFYVQFIRTYLQVEERFPTWDKIFKLLLIIVILVIIQTPVTLFVLEDLFINIHISRIAAFGFFAVIVVFIIKLFLINETMPRIIAVGSSILIIGTSLSLILVLNTMDISGWLFQKVGFLLELIVFMFALSYRHWLTEEEKHETQEKLILQLNKNAELQTRVQKELEDRVKERTLEINRKNRKLEQQNIEITAQRDEIETQHRIAVEQKEHIEGQNKSIKDSIQYAQKIQSAILPPDSILRELVDELFILYKPKDIVSGDFYWIKQVNKYIVIVAADCTGHGVPGALMSMLGISYLNEIVQTKEITQANQILNELRYQIRHSLRQHGLPDESKDGIDMALCVIDTKNRKMQYAGAYNPLYIIRADQDMPELKEIKADRMPVGYYQGKVKSFSNHNIPLEVGDIFYIFSDGFVDQKGGPDNRKFMSKNFKNLLLEIHEQPMHDQQSILDKTLTVWMGNNPQMDDILVIGFRV